MLPMKDVINYLEELFPRKLAYEWDNVGLQVGNLEGSVSRILLALDATTPVIMEAMDTQSNLIITHHPFIFEPLKSLDTSTPQGKNIKRLMEKNATIYTLHTNYDVASGGMNDLLVEAIGLQSVTPFAMVDEVHGLGRMGELEKDISLSDSIRHLKDALNLENLHYVQGNESPINKVAVIGGSGGKYIHEAKALGADLFITGDVTHHTAVDAQEIGLNVIDIGHYAETIMLERLASLLNQKFGDNRLEALVSKASKNPIQLGN